ncbi:MAG: gliding motility-associated lipoprotein GldB [Roseivirga sp.]|jgi:gliding motility-associated lipoprotein GldB
MARILGFLLILLLLISCDNEIKNKIDVSGINVNVTVDRFEEKFYTTSEEDLPKLKSAYAFMFANVHDSTSLRKMKSEEELFLFDQSKKVFGNFESQKEELTDLFKHIKYYNPNFEEPKVITHISDLDFEYPVIYADSLLFIALDMYLGKESEVYRSFPMYIAQNYKKEHIVVDVAKDIINRSLPKFRSRRFIDKIINHGKEIYFLERFLPTVSDSIKMGYSSNKMKWAEANEIDVWKYFIENELLYSSDSDLDDRFIGVAPFSKFYQASDGDSPGRIGVWIGWQIVRSYMRNNDVTLQQLITVPSEDIYKNSKYKPRK